MDQLRAAMDRYLQAMQEQLKNKQQLARPLDRNTRALRSQDLKSMIDQLEHLARSGANDAARQMLQQLEQMMENLQMATPDMNGDDDLGDRFGARPSRRDDPSAAGLARPHLRQGQDQRRQPGPAVSKAKQGQEGQQGQRGRAAAKLAGAAGSAQEAP